MTTSPSFLSIKTMSGLLVPIFRSHWWSQNLEVFTFHHSLRLLFILAISSFQSTFTTTLPVDIPGHVIMPSSIFCLRQLTALTHHMGHRFSLTSAHSAQSGFRCVIDMKSRITCSQSLFLGAAHHGLSTSFQISFCNPLSGSIPVNIHILPMRSFLLPFILRLLYFIHFVLIWVHSLWDVAHDYIAIISNFLE